MEVLSPCCVLSIVNVLVITSSNWFIDHIIDQINLISNILLMNENGIAIWYANWTCDELQGFWLIEWHFGYHNAKVSVKSMKYPCFQ
jgi:hypothetical protein